MLQQSNPLNRDLIVNINGRLVHRDEAGVSPFDSAVQNGDGVWEGLRLYNGSIFKLSEHLARLRKSAVMLEYDGYPSDDILIDQLKATLAVNKMFNDVHIRLTVSRGIKYTSGLDPRVNQLGCSYIILAEHKPPVYDRTGIRLITANHRRPPRQVLDQRIHSCNQLTSILAKIEANAVGADDALMLDLDGNLAETNATHVFIVKDGIVQTSPCAACPEGITRATVLELCEDHSIPCNVTDIPQRDLYDADEMLVTGTMGELVPVVQLDDHIYTPGPVTSMVSELFAELVQSGRCSTAMMGR